MADHDPSSARAPDPDFEVLYAELRRLARHLLQSERTGHTLQATALVNEAWVRLQRSAPETTGDPRAFQRNAAHAMRHILIDHSRRHNSAKRSGGADRIPLDALELAGQGLTGDLLAVDEAIAELERRDPDLAELVRLRFFAGLGLEQIAESLGRSVRSVHRDWHYAKALLMKSLAGE